MTDVDSSLICRNVALISFLDVCFTAWSLSIIYHSVGSIPCSEDFVPQIVCGCCYLQCFPEFGLCRPPPESKALEFLTEKPAASRDAPAATEMDRGGDKEDLAMEENVPE